VPRSRLLALLSVTTSLCILGISASASAQPRPLPDYAPLLPQSEARTWAVDPQKGYVVRALKPGVFLVTDGGYQAMFATTGKGVVLFDAPPSVASHITQAVADVTTEPIVVLVYSHIHVDHIGGAGLILRQHPGLRIIAERGVARFLGEQDDPTRPAPTEVFDDHETLSLGAMTAELKVGHWHSPPGDLFIYLPGKKVLMAVDTLSSGSVPFMGLDLTQNMDAYVRVFDQLLGYDFDVLVPGHHSNPSTRDDVKVVRDYVMDIYGTIRRIQDADHSDLTSRAAAKYGRANSYAIARVLIDSEVDQCANEIIGRWKSRLDDVDVWAASQCRTALVYYEWDVGRRGED
jgi:glyoxylase-like metal-dependent hydrolase (beta-lactamase superfamily II)